MSNIIRPFYKILVVGASGRGKTYSLRNLNKDKVAFVNLENKPLPFSGRFKHQYVLTGYDQIYELLTKLGSDPNVNAIVLDSLSAWLDLLLFFCRQTKKGFDIWSSYATEIGRLMQYIKQCPKEIVVTAHSEILLTEEGWNERRVKVKGREWEGLIEKEFTVVLFAEARKEKEKRTQYYFSLGDANNSAKCPPEIFGEETFMLPNDMKFVLEKVAEFARTQATPTDEKTA